MFYRLKFIWDNMKAVNGYVSPVAYTKGQVFGIKVMRLLNVLKDYFKLYLKASIEFFVINIIAGIVIHKGYGISYEAMRYSMENDIPLMFAEVLFLYIILDILFIENTLKKK